ncbi:MAG: hypothetical protein ACPGUY_09465, partial [Akkermansiaceae bacterium]
YEEGTPKSFLTQLELLQKNKTQRDAAIKAAAELTGTEKARTLEKALSNVPRMNLSHYDPEIEMIAKADPDDASGFVGRYRAQKTHIDLSKQLHEIFKQRRYKDACAQVDTYISAHQPKNQSLQVALLYKLHATFMSKDFDAAEKLADQVIAVNEDSRPSRYAQVIKRRINRQREESKAEE